MKTVLVCYLTLKRTEPSALKGLNAVRKFLLIKLVFYFFILNRLIQQLVDPRPLFCREEKSQLAQWVCKIRFRYWVGSLEVAILSLLLLRWFGTSDFNSSTTTSEAEQPSSAPTSSAPTFYVSQLIVRVFTFRDINRSYVYPAPAFRSCTTKPQSKSSTLNSTEDSNKVIPLPVQVS